MILLQFTCQKKIEEYVIEFPTVEYTDYMVLGNNEGGNIDERQ